MLIENILGILFPLLLVVLSGHIIWKSTDAFEVAADYLGRKMSQGVKGATINAVASSMPEFLTTMFFLFYIKEDSLFVDSFSGGLGVVAGSAVFNILIIPLAIIFFGGVLQKGGFKLDKKVIKRDGIFLLFSNVILIVIVAQSEIKTGHGIILVLSYLIYLSLLRKGLGIHSKEKEGSLEQFKIEHTPFRLKHLFFLDIKKLLLNGKTLNRGNAWLSISISTLVMSFGTWMLVEGTKLLGESSYAESLPLLERFGIHQLKGLGIPIVFLSVLIAAAATSIPDTMISIRDARKGNHDDSISNAIGSNIFDISFAIGFPLLLFTLFHGGSFSMSTEIQHLSFGILLAMWLINTIVILIFIPQKLNIRGKALLLAFLYLAFITFIVLEKSINDHFISVIIDFLDKLF